ncbi:phytoene/squalene synthase family protein [Rhodanobacter sp. BL-MT-08]
MIHSFPANQATDPAYASANAALTRHGRSFYWARHLLSEQHAERATILYGFCRLIDDLADGDITATPREALAAMSAALVRGRSTDPLTASMIRLMRECHIDPAIPLQLIRGVESDLGTVQIADEAQLLRYCYCVAGTVGLMMSAALDTSDPNALPHAIDLGVAMQLTNICRDVSADGLAGRRYLPASLIGPLSPRALVIPDRTHQPMLRSAITTLLDMADRYYRSGEAGLAYLPARARSGILVAARIYRDIGSELRRRECDYWSERVHVTMTRKVAITLGALANVSLLPRFRQPLRPHDAALHGLLENLPHAHVTFTQRHAC